MKIAFSALGLAVLLAGCATQNLAGISSYQAVPAENIIGTVPELQPGEPAGTAIVKRDPGMLGAALSSVLLINGKQVVRLKPGEYIHLRVPTGENLFGVSWSDNFGVIATSSTREIAVEVKSDQTYYIRMFPLVGNGIAIERSSH